MRRQTLKFGCTLLPEGCGKTVIAAGVRWRMSNEDSTRKGRGIHADKNVAWRESRDRAVVVLKVKGVRPPPCVGDRFAEPAAACKRMYLASGRVAVS